MIKKLSKRIAFFIILLILPFSKKGCCLYIKGEMSEKRGEFLLFHIISF
jgi:hypothetical protein